MGLAAPEDIARFRSIWASYGSAGMSWWSWQSTSEPAWGAIAAPLTPLPFPLPDPGWPTLTSGVKGDEVIWLQQHLTQSYPTVTVNGKFDTATGDAIKAIQTANGIAVTGTTDASTWAAALALPYTPVDWTARR